MNAATLTPPVALTAAALDWYNGIVAQLLAEAEPHLRSGEFVGEDPRGDFLGDDPDGELHDAFHEWIDAKITAEVAPLVVALSPMAGMVAHRHEPYREHEASYWGAPASPFLLHVARWALMLDISAEAVRRGIVRPA